MDTRALHCLEAVEALDTHLFFSKLLPVTATSLSLSGPQFPHLHHLLYLP